MGTKRLAFVRLILALSVLFSLEGQAQAGLQAQAGVQAIPELYVFPLEGSPGGTLHITAYNILPAGAYRLLIWDGISPEGLFLGEYTTDRNGTLAGTAILPDLPAGPYTILFENPDYPSTPFTVLPALSLALEPGSGPPGTHIGFTVTGLPAGRLRLDYDGVPLLGPLAVPAGVYTGSFTVPRDRPATLGDPVQVEAVSLVGSEVAGKASAIFSSKPIPAPLAYRIANVTLPSAPVNPGQAFLISGQIDPPPVGPLSQYQLKVMWKSGGGKVFPITNGAPSLQADGSFQVSAILPSLLNGAPDPAEEGGQVGVVFSNSGNNAPVILYTPFGDFPPPAPFRIKVVNAQGQPIPNAIVDLRGALADLAITLSNKKVDGSVVSLNPADLLAEPNQILWYGNGSIFPTEKDPFNCAPSPVYGRTDASGIFQPKLPLSDWLALAGKKVDLGPSYPGSYLITPKEITFSVNVTGQYQGYGQVVNKVPVPWKMDIRYKATTGAFYKDEGGKLTLINADPLVVTLQPVPAGTSLEQPIELKIQSATPLAKFDNYVGTGIPLVAFGKFMSFASLTDYPDSIFLNPPAGLTVSFDHDASLYGSLDQASITLTIDNKTYPFTAITSEQCNGLTYRATIPKYYRLTPGAHLGLVQVKDMANPPVITKRYIQIYLSSPPDWFHDPALVHRSVFYGTYHSLQISGDILKPGDPASNSTLNANLNKVGQVNNLAGATGTFTQWFSPSTAGNRKFEGKLNYMAVNSGDSQDISQSATTNTPITFKDGPIEILDSGRFPLFRDTWGIPPIAGATIGADMWFNATLTYNGTIQLAGPGGGASYTVTVDPEATVGVDAWLDASALMGIIDAQAHAIPKISMSLPVTFKDGIKIDATRCFKYRLDIKWSASVGYCPLCISDSGTENIFKGHTPNPSNYCSDPATSVQATATPPMPAASPSLAVDGAGSVLAVWRAEDGTIKYSRYTGLAWQPPAVLSANQSGGSPRVAFYAPGKAVAVWTQNALTPQAAQSAPFATLAQNQHLVFAAWNGTSWSAPQSLTPKTTGEGAVSLAGCLSTTAGCPAGGAVAAVWVRDIAGDLSQHQLRLFTATFQGGVWSAPQAVDPASTAMDSEPSLAYQNGAPLVAWIRDADRNLGTLSDRKVAYRRLDGADSVHVPADLPAGAVEPSLATGPSGALRLAFTLATNAGGLSGNQRQLYTAAQSCSGGCTWSVQPLVDGHGRVIRAEAPHLTINGAGAGAIVYRGLGMGPLPGGGYQAFPEDAPGIIQGSGEVSKVQVNFTSPAVSPQYLTQDGLNKWQVASVFDPLTSQVLVVAAMPGGLLSPNVGTKPGTPSTLAQNEPVIALSVSDQPDFAIGKLVPSAVYLSTGDGLTVAAGIVNGGSLAEQDLLVEAAWDGPPGTGIPAGSITILAPTPGEVITASLAIDTNVVNLDQPHLLYMAVNPYQAIPESTAENNESRAVIGGLAPPSGLTALAKAGSSLVFLSWSAPPDARVAGYHVYRFEDDGRSVLPVGSAFKPNFADLFASLDGHYQYAVASFNDAGEESVLSQKVEVNPVSLSLYFPSISR